MMLLVSLVLNWQLFQQSSQYYRELNETRLDPLGLKTFRDNETATSNQKVVVFFGDSHAAQWPTPNLKSFTFINRGIGAQTTAQVLARFDAHVALLHPHIVVVNVGINDLKTIPLWPERKAKLIAECKTHFHELVTRSVHSGATVILTTLFPIGTVPLVRRPFWSDDVAQAVDDVNAYLFTLQSSNVIVLDAYAVLAQQGAMRPEYVLDTLHINEAGYAVLNVELTKVLESLK
jgi:lysophospholipase L1-like esterase